MQTSLVLLIITIMKVVLGESFCGHGHICPAATSDASTDTNKEKLHIGQPVDFFPLA